MIVSFAAVFRDVMQRFPERKGALRDIPKEGCEGEAPNDWFSIIKHLDLRYHEYNESYGFFSFKAGLFFRHK